MERRGCGAAGSAVVTPLKRAAHAAQAALVEAIGFAFRSLPWRASLAVGARLGDAARFAGLRARVAAANLAHAFPERDAAWRHRVLITHYRELGRVVAEYARMGELVRAAPGAVIAVAPGLEHLEALRGHGAILMSGHFGNIELLGAWCGRLNPTSVMVRPLTNPLVDRWVMERRRDSGIELIDASVGVRRAYQALREGRWVAMLADQDARRHGVFVPFLGRPASTPTGPAVLSIRARVPIVMAFDVRRADLRHEMHVEPPFEAEDPEAADAVERLTARHVAVLERWVRRNPEMWFWLHRRWKTPPPVEEEPLASVRA
jgi:KDO2-lipid IV(A) lauroyltransferase